MHKTCTYDYIAAACEQLIDNNLLYFLSLQLQDMDEYEEMLLELSGQAKQKPLAKPAAPPPVADGKVGCIGQAPSRSPSLLSSFSLPLTFYLDQKLSTLASRMYGVHGCMPGFHVQLFKLKLSLNEEGRKL